jgi:hypothetical protein
MADRVVDGIDLMYCMRPHDASKEHDQTVFLRPYVRAYMTPPEPSIIAVALFKPVLFCDPGSQITHSFYPVRMRIHNRDPPASQCCSVFRSLLQVPSNECRVGGYQVPTDNDCASDGLSRKDGGYSWVHAQDRVGNTRRWSDIVFYVCPM